MHPLERLGRWSVDRFVSVSPGSVDADRVFVITHGWAPGALEAVREVDGDLRVWDASAVASTGRRFDDWIRDLAAQITRTAPDAAVLCFSWIDESATKRGNLRAIESQRRTTANGQRLAVALDHALPRGSTARPHLIGYSHGARVATVAATVLRSVPSHLTLLDSPDGLLPVLGGGLNDLSSLLRIVSHRVHEDGTEVRVDNYPSAFGIRYGRQRGLDRIVDVVLEPPNPADAANSDLVAVVSNALSDGHRYAPEWYTDSARLDLPIGFGWSALMDPGAWPGPGECRVAGPDEPFDLVFEPKEAVSTDDPSIEHSVRSGSGDAVVLRVDGGSTAIRSLAWRTRGDQIALLPIRWIEGDPDAQVRVMFAGRERGSTTRGWSSEPQREVILPVGDIRRGPMSVLIELTASGPAAVEIRPAAAIHHFRLPAFAELRSWLYPLSLAVLAGAVAALATLTGRLVRRRRRRHRSGS